jgi:hypothetical protein
MLGSSIHATIKALRITLADLQHLAPSDELTQLRRILLLRIAELESGSDFRASSNTDKKP